MIAAVGPAASVVARVLAPLEHDPDELRSRADDLLSRPPYRQHEPGLVDRLLDRLGDLVARLLDALALPPAARPLAAWATLAVGVALLLAVVWRATRGMTPDRDGRTSPIVDSSRTAADWFAAADGHAAAGRLREAIRCRYAGLVVALQASGTILPLPGRTVHELDTEIADSAPRIAERVAAAGERFQDAVFGGLPVTPEDLEVVDAAAAAVLEETGAAVGATRAGGAPEAAG